MIKDLLSLALILEGHQLPKRTLTFVENLFADSAEELENLFRKKNS